MVVRSERSCLMCCLQWKRVQMQYHLEFGNPASSLGSSLAGALAPPPLVLDWMLDKHTGAITPLPQLLHPAMPLVQGKAATAQQPKLSTEGGIH